MVVHISVISGSSPYIHHRTEAGRIWKQLERDERKRKAAEKKKKEEESKIMDLIKSRGIKVEQRKGK